MSWLPLTRKRRLLLAMVDDAAASLEREVRGLFGCQATMALDGEDPLARECAIFIFWSVHVGIVNAETTALDRCLARWLLGRRIRRAHRSRDGLVAGYEQRCRQALATTPNIFLYRKNGDQLPVLPVTLSGARLFLRQIDPRHASPHLLPRLADTLRAHFWACAVHFQPRIRPRFP